MVKEQEKVAQEEEQRPEAFEKKRMGREDAQSRSRQAWDILQSVSHPYLNQKKDVPENQI